MGWNFGTLDSCSSCPVEFTVNLIGGKWKLLVLYQLLTRETD